MPSEYKKVFFDHLDKHNIDYLKTGYLDWVLEHQLPIDDTFHPYPGTGSKFAEDVLYPILRKFKI